MEKFEHYDGDDACHLTQCFPPFRPSAASDKRSSKSNTIDSADHITTEPHGISSNWTDRQSDIRDEASPSFLRDRVEDDMDEVSSHGSQSDGLSLLTMLRLLPLPFIGRSASITKNTNEYDVNDEISRASTPPGVSSHASKPTESTPLLGSSRLGDEVVVEKAQATMTSSVTWLANWLGLVGDGSPSQATLPTTIVEQTTNDPIYSHPSPAYADHENHLKSNTSIHPVTNGGGFRSISSETNASVKTIIVPESSPANTTPSLRGMLSGSLTNGSSLTSTIPTQVISGSFISQSLPNSSIHLKTSAADIAAQDNAANFSSKILRHRASISSIPETPTNSPSLSNNPIASPSKIPLFSALLNSPVRNSPQRSISSTAPSQSHAFESEVHISTTPAHSNTIKPPADIGVRGIIGESISRSSTPSHEVNLKDRKLKSGGFVPSVQISITESSNTSSELDSLGTKFTPSSPQQVSPSRNYFGIQTRRPSIISQTSSTKGSFSPQRKFSLPSPFTGNKDQQHSNSNLGVATQLQPHQGHTSSNSGRRSSTSTPSPSQVHHGVLGYPNGQSPKLPHWRPFGIHSKDTVEEFAGHYILFVGYDPDTDGFLYRDPGTMEALCVMDGDEVERARSSPGTDHDVIVVRVAV
jgi:hypothetical protein